jgi:hypothetical protein
MQSHKVVIKNVFFVFLIILFQFITSCKNSKYQNAIEYSREILAAKNVEIDQENQKIQLTFVFDSSDLSLHEYPASVGLVTFYDSANREIIEDKISQIEIKIKDKNNDNTYLYAVNQINLYKKVLEKAGLITEFFINQNTIQLENYVDINQISVNDLNGLFDYSQLIQKEERIGNYSVDGFLILPDNQKIQVKINLIQPNFENKLTLQFDLKSGLMTYLGVNDDL